MTYPAPPNDPVASRIRPDAAPFWSGAAATAVVAALIALVGILICRWTLTIPILAPAGEGAWGDADTGVYVFLAAVVALVAAGVLYLLELGAPQPRLFFHWITGLATAVAVAFPFSTSAPVNQKAATAIVDLVLGLAIISLLSATSARAVRRRPPADRRPLPPTFPVDEPGYPAGPTYVDDGSGYSRGPGRPAEPGYPQQGYPTRPDQGNAARPVFRPGPGNAPGPADQTRPIDYPQDRDQRPR
jgi:hypothetical protein